LRSFPPSSAARTCSGIQLDIFAVLFKDLQRLAGGYQEFADFFPEICTAGNALTSASPTAFLPEEETFKDEVADGEAVDLPPPVDEGSEMQLAPQSYDMLQCPITLVRPFKHLGNALVCNGRQPFYHCGLTHTFLGSDVLAS